MEYQEEWIHMCNQSEQQPKTKWRRCLTHNSDFIKMILTHLAGHCTTRCSMEEAILLENEVCQCAWSNGRWRLKLSRITTTTTNISMIRHHRTTILQKVPKLHMLQPVLSTNKCYKEVEILWERKESPLSSANQLNNLWNLRIMKIHISISTSSSTSNGSQNHKLNTIIPIKDKCNNNLKDKTINQWNLMPRLSPCLSINKCFKVEEI